MEKFKKCLSLLLVMSFLIPPIPASAVVAPEDEDPFNTVPTGATVPVTNPDGTVTQTPATSCQKAGEAVTSSQVCCAGLAPNANNVCDFAPIVDTALVSCNSNADCSGGTSCHPQTSADPYSNVSPNTSPDADDFRTLIEGEVDDEENILSPIGGNCATNANCTSYSCVGGKCEDKKICRFAKEGEVAIAPVKCGRDLVPGADGKCGPSPDAANQTYVGLADPNSVSMNAQCQMNLPTDLKKNFIISMKSMRAMEVFLSNITIAPRTEECFDVIPYLKELTRDYVKQRKELIYKFTKGFNELEKDYETLKNAKEDGPDANEIVTIHGGEQILVKDLATRLTSGYDALMIMYRRNLLFKEYEEAMKEVTTKFEVNFKKMEEAYAGWDEQKLTLQPGGIMSTINQLVQYSNYMNSRVFPMGFPILNDAGAQVKPDSVQTWKCRASMWQKKSWWRWKDKFYMTTKDRWSVQYDVTGTNGGVSSIVKDDFIANTLGLIHKVDKAEAVKTYTASKYYLLNPMIYWGRNPSTYGPVKKLQSKGGFLGFSGKRDLRKAYFITNYGRMLEDSRPTTIKHFTSLRDTELFKKEPLTNFLSEPDLVTTAAKDCLHNPKDPSKCADFNTFMKEVQNETFAHFLAFAYTPKDNYSGYFSNAKSGRLSYYSKILVDTQRLNDYYDIVIKARVDQNTCLDKLMNGIEDSGILAGGPGGLTPGGTYWIPGRPTGNGLNPTNTRTNVTNDQLRALRRQGFNFNNSNSSLTTSTSSNLDNVAGSTSSSSGSSLSDSDRAFLASRRSAMRKANDKAAKAGVDVAKQKKAVKEIEDEIMNKSIAGRGAGTGAGLASGGASSGGGFGSAGTASVSATNPDGSTGPTGEGISAAESINLNTAGVQSGANAGANGLAGIAAGANSGYGDGSGVNAGAGSGAGDGKDGTGLSDADKERLMSEYERNKKDYLGSEEDGLFSKVSKAYVRNLDKVLIKKKKIEP